MPVYGDIKLNLNLAVTDVVTSLADSMYLDEKRVTHSDPCKTNRGVLQLARHEGIQKHFYLD